MIVPLSVPKYQGSQLRATSVMVTDPSVRRLTPGPPWQRPYVTVTTKRMNTEVYGIARPSQSSSGGHGFTSIDTIAE